MENARLFKVDINGFTGEILVAEKDGGKYMCTFKKNETTDFARFFDAYGFVVWTKYLSHGEIEFYPIKLREDTKLSIDIMHDIWMQIMSEMKS